MKTKSNAEPPVIKVFGFGGCGCNTIANLHHAGLAHGALIAANTDFFSLSRTIADKKIQLGEKICKGLGAGGDIHLGRLAAEESYRTILREMQDASLIILTAGMGGGTGSGAIEIAARIASSLDIPVVSFVSLPFSFESETRKTNAFEASLNLQPFTNTLVTIPNDKILAISEKSLPLHEALIKADSLLINWFSGLMDLIDHTGMMHIDLSYILHAVQSENGVFISTGAGSGSDAVRTALVNALNNPILENGQLQSARHAVIKFNGGLSVQALNPALELLRQQGSPDIEITPIIGMNSLPEGQVSVSLLLAGLGATPITYPASWLPQNLPATQKTTPGMLTHRSNQELHEAPFEDILEVPAFIRKGRMNEKKAY